MLMRAIMPMITLIAVIIEMICLMPSRRRHECAWLLSMLLLLRCHADAMMPRALSR